MSQDEGYHWLSRSFRQVYQSVWSLLTDKYQLQHVRNADGCTTFPPHAARRQLIWDLLKEAAHKQAYARLYKSGYFVAAHMQTFCVDSTHNFIHEAPDPRTLTMFFFYASDSKGNAVSLHDVVSALVINHMALMHAALTPIAAALCSSSLQYFRLTFWLIWTEQHMDNTADAWLPWWQQHCISSNFFSTRHCVGLPAKLLMWSSNIRIRSKSTQESQVWGSWLKGIHPFVFSLLFASLPSSRQEGR